MFNSLKKWFTRRFSMRRTVLDQLTARPIIKVLSDDDACHQMQRATDSLIREEEETAKFMAEAGASQTLCKYHIMVKNELLELNGLRSEIHDIYKQLDKM